MITDKYSEELIGMLLGLKKYEWEQVKSGVDRAFREKEKYIELDDRKTLTYWVRDCVKLPNKK